MSRRSKQKHDRRTLRQKISLRKILRFLFSRMVIVGVLIFLQLAFLVALLVTLEGHLVYAGAQHGCVRLGGHRRGQPCL